MPSDVAERLRAGAARALAAIPVRWAYLYGSQAGGRPRPDSDVDVAVMLAEEVPPEKAQVTGFRCADALGQATGLARIEALDLRAAPLRFVGRILRQRVVIYSRDEPGRVAWESLQARMADDVELWAARTDRELLDEIAHGRR